MNKEAPLTQKPIITPADIVKAMEFRLQKQKPQETYIQQSCKVIFDGIKLEMRDRFEMDFMQVDNGGKQTQGGKFRKKAEGTSRVLQMCNYGFTVKRLDFQKWFYVNLSALARLLKLTSKKNRLLFRFVGRNFITAMDLLQTTHFILNGKFMIF